MLNISSEYENYLRNSQLKKIVIIGCLLVVSKSLMATSLINDMQACQALIEFVDNKLNAAPLVYDKEEVENVRKGLKSYNQFIQREIVSPGLLKFNGGDKEKAHQMQKQIDIYKNSLIKQLEMRYPQKRLLMDQVIAMNNCTKKSVPSNKALETLKESLNTMLKLAKMNK